jgi:hypothetical protein
MIILFLIVTKKTNVTGVIDQVYFIVTRSFIHQYFN